MSSLICLTHLNNIPFYINPDDGSGQNINLNGSKIRIIYDVRLESNETIPNYIVSETIDIHNIDNPLRNIVEFGSFVNCLLFVASFHSSLVTLTFNLT